MSASGDESYASDDLSISQSSTPPFKVPNKHPNEQSTSESADRNLTQAPAMFRLQDMRDELVYRFSPANGNPIHCLYPNS